ncbi:MAG: hypothetical protein Unbinned767contig1000_36 [Prokaryotic dsDNA virus sp.]|nr:MAG: hypothetical protein Unbinned767contig1000_36 [Prokaryotic dsDNA virus sp.]|tara:strand:- start:30301 stop:30570 length:270 start_codon:yes stop_codon:yes gene_type:complete
MSEDTPKKKKAPAKKETGVDPVLYAEVVAMLLQVETLFTEMLVPRTGMRSEMTSWEFGRQRSMGKPMKEEAQIWSRTVDGVHSLVARLR